jgi:hypothetical protein
MNWKALGSCLAHSTYASVFALASFFSLLQISSAAILTLPGSSFASTEGNSRLANTFNGLGHTQALYQSSLFSTGRISITGIRVRADNGLYPASNYTNSSFKIEASATSRTAATLSSTFSTNFGASRTTVLNGPVSFNYASGSNPNPFGGVISFTTPFTYDPTSGQSLLLDLSTSNIVFVADGGFDADRHMGVTGAGLVTALDPSAANGFYVGSAEALVIQLQYSTLTEIVTGNPAPVVGDGVTIDFSSVSSGGTLSVSRDLLSPSSIVVPGGFVVPGTTLQSWNLGFNNAAITGPVTLTFTYDPSLLAPGTRESDLKIYHVFSDGSGGQVLNPTIDESLNKLTVQVDRFSTFNLLAAPVASTPEPASLFAWSAMGLLGVAARFRRRKG